MHKPFEKWVAHERDHKEDEERALSGGDQLCYLCSRRGDPTHDCWEAVYNWQDRELTPALKQPRFKDVAAFRCLYNATLNPQP